LSRISHWTFRNMCWKQKGGMSINEIWTWCGCTGFLTDCNHVFPYMKYGRGITLWILCSCQKQPIALCVDYVKSSFSSSSVMGSPVIWMKFAL
jgi:hypothetical protein